MTMHFRTLLIFWLILGLAGCGHPKHAAIPTGATVLVLGDSLSFGTGANSGEDYPSLLARSTGWNIINAGVPGDTSADGLERLPDLLETHAPKLVLVELGGNDFLGHQSRAQITQNLRTILNNIKARGVPAVLLAVPAPTPMGAALGNLSDDPLYGQLGKETQTAVIEDVLSDVLSKNTLKSDPLHPNAKGYRQIADGLQEALRDLGFLK